MLPARLILLGEALEPVAKAARQALTRRVRPSGQGFVMLDDPIRHLGVIQEALTHLSPRLDGLMADVGANEGATALEVGRAAGRLEQVLSEFVDGYLEAKASQPGPDSIEARTLIIGVYRHHIKSICRWLEELVAAIADPAGAVRKRRLALAPTVELTVVLNMTTPPQMAALSALSMRLRYPPESAPAPPPDVQSPAPRPPGLLDTIGALVFGIGLARAALGRRRHGYRF